MFAAMLIGGMPMGAMYGAIHSNVPERLRASSIAILSVVATLLGQGLGPLVTGLISDRLALSIGIQQSLKWALIVMTTLGLWPPVHMFLAARQQSAIARRRS
jgi:MFS family permease